MQHREKIHVSWLVAVFVGGFIGGILRYVISGVTHDGTTMMGTTIVNLIGSFLLAFTTYGLDMKFDLPEWLLLALGTGVIGGFTTFSRLCDLGTKACDLCHITVDAQSAGRAASSNSRILGCETRWKKGQKTMVILIGIGAGLGAVCRYGITVLGKMLWPGKPLATLLINVLGSLLAGLLVGLPTLSAFRLFLLPGFCGGFTTFSTFMADAFILIKNRRWSMAIFYYVGTVVAGMVAVVVGMMTSGILFA